MTTTILSVVLAVAFLAIGAARLRMIPLMSSQARALGIHEPQFRLIGVLEILFALLVLAGIRVSWMGTLGALLMTGAAALAIIAHARANDLPKNYVPAGVLGLLAFVLFLVHIYAE
jgi:uncharacterized membrane protein YphA (DoxX/SURF4 family)